MKPSETTTNTFRLREMQCQDEAGRQVLLRLDDGGDLIFAGVFNAHGDRLYEKEKESRFEIAIRLKPPGREEVIFSLHLCCGPDGMGNWVCKWCP